MRSFDEAARDVLERAGYKPRTPDELINWWDNLIKQCEDGYEWTIYEFDDEMAVRDYVSLVLRDESLQPMPEYVEFKHSIDELDNRFRAMLQEGVKRPFKRDDWWRTGVLRYAGSDYCEDMESRYSISVDEHEDD